MLFCLILFFFGLPFIAWNAEEPGMQEQTLSIRFRTGDEAEKSKLLFSFFPDGKSIAFSSRWDDSNDKHARVAEILQKYGMKGTFHHNRTTDSYDRETSRRILQAGSSIGAHSMTHPSLPFKNANTIFQEIMMNRVEQESRTNSPVVSFVLPYCAHSTGNGEEKGGRRIGTALSRAGLLIFPEFQTKIGRKYGLSDRFCHTTHLFSPGDRRPDIKKFRAEVKKNLQQIEKEKNESDRFLSFGIHSWFDEEGFGMLEECIKEFSGNPDWWYCSMNEYASYRSQVEQTTVRKENISGNQADFLLRRPMTGDLGADMPLHFSVIPEPEQLLWNGKKLERRASGFYELPPPDRFPVPKKITFLKDGMKSPNSCLSAKMIYSPEKNAVSVELMNDSREKRSGLRLLLRLPPGWKTEVLQKNIPLLKGGESRQMTFLLGDRSSDPDCLEGDILFVLQLDDGVERIYAVAEQKQPPQTFLCGGRDTGAFAGPFLPTPETFAALKGSSCVEKERIAPGICGEWIANVPEKNDIPELIHVFSRNQEWKDASKSFFMSSKKGVMALRFLSDFPKSGRYRLNASTFRLKATFIHGKEISLGKDLSFFHAKGKYAVVLLYETPVQSPGSRAVSVSSLE